MGADLRLLPPARPSDGDADRRRTCRDLPPRPAKPWRARRRRWPWFLGLTAVVIAVALLAPPTSFGLPDAGTRANADDDGWRPALTDESGTVDLESALALGQEGGIPLYACRAPLAGGLQLGRVRSDFTGCHIGYGGKEVQVAPFEVLAPVWRDVTRNTVWAPGALRVGEMAGADGRLVKLYACRAKYQGRVQFGQAVPGQQGCSFGFGGRAITVTDGYSVLDTAPWLTWTAALGRNLPDGAVADSEKGPTLPRLCRAADRDGLHPGKIDQGALGCSIVSAGHEVVAERFEVLVPRWSLGLSGSVPVSAYPAGREDGAAQFVCRVRVRDTVQIGKASEALGGCHVGMNQGEATFNEYDLLSQ